MNGYILESRTILNSPIWDKPPLYFKVWHYLLLNAQHTDYKGLKRGQLVTSIPEIQEACAYYVGYRKVTPTKKEIYGIVNFLRNPCGGNHGGNNEESMIVTAKVTHGMLVTICNYNIYQNPKNYESNNGKDTKVTTKELRKERQGNNINKNDKNDKNDKEERERTAHKSAYGRKGKVLLTDEEYKAIKDYFTDADGLINHVGEYLANASKRYEDHDSLIWQIGKQDKWAVKRQTQTYELTQEEIDRMRTEAFGEGWKQ